MEIDYSKAPAWADEVFYIKGSVGADYYFGNRSKYQHHTGGVNQHSDLSLQIISNPEGWVRIPLNLENI